MVRGNRLEKGTVSLTDSLSCHTDNQNGRVLGFTYNVSHFKYHRNPAVLDPASKDAFQRTHMGGYSRKICDSTLEKADNVEALGELVLEYLKQAPEGNKIFDPSILERREGDEDDQYEDDVVVRDIHLNKVALYSFYLYYLNDWVHRHKLRDHPVEWHEYLDAVLTAVRWTSCPTTWAFIFQKLTANDGVEIEVPKGLECPGLPSLFLQQNGNLIKLPTYMSPLPFWLQYIFLSISETGGLGRGIDMRFQPFSHSSNIDIIRELRSRNQFHQLVDELLVDLKPKLHSSMRMPLSTPRK